LRHIHARRIVHRDFKSENIFLASNESDGCIVKIGDFGTSKMLDHTRAMATTLIGTPSHLSPEVCDNTPYSSKADIWSLGVVFYELLTLEAPFQATNLAALVLKIVISEPKPVPIEYYSIEVRGFIKPMLEKDPAIRPSAAQLLQEKVLRQVARLSSLPSLIGPVTRPASFSEAETLTPNSLCEAGEAAPLAGQAKERGRPGSPEILRRRGRETCYRRRRPPALDAPCAAANAWQHLDQGQPCKLHQLSPAVMQRLQLPALEPSSLPPTPIGGSGDCKNRQALSVGLPRRRTFLHPLDCQPQITFRQAQSDRTSFSPSPGRANTAMRFAETRRASGSRRCGSQPPSMVSSPVGDPRCMTLPEVLRSSPQRFAHHQNHLEKGVSEAETSGTRRMLRPRLKMSATQEALAQQEKDEVPNLPRLLGRLRGPEVVVGGKDKI